MAFDGRWKLVSFSDDPAHGQLFDLEGDPRELADLWDHPAHADQRQRLLEATAAWRQEVLFSSRDWWRAVT